MSLATRCTACGTIFRVVQDQLRVSDGWVRCGRCAEVFDAREQLFDMDREPPPAWPAQGAPMAPAEAMVEEQAPVQMMAPAPHHAEPAIEEGIESWDEAPEAPPPAAPPPEPSSHQIEPHFDEPEEAMPSAVSHERVDPAFIEIEDHQPDVVLTSKLAELAADPADAPSPAAVEKKAEQSATPEFVRRAQAQQRWQRPGVRLALGFGCVLAFALLAAQFAWQFRDSLAAQYPAAAPSLRAACEALGCKIQPWRHIEAISVEQSALSQAGSGNNYKLALTLRNKSSYELALPWVDLSLTDASGQLVARRMLSPADFNLKTDRLGPNAEQPLQLVFGSGAQRVTGYTVEIFNP